MSFNSIEFAILLLCVFVLYWFIFKQQRKQQNILILIASYIFYGWWDWRFLILIFVSSLSAYILGIHIDKKEDLKSRKLLLALSIVINLGIFSFFKYFNFFVDSFVDLLNLLGININYTSLHIILPIGISFYTFQTLSYTIDIFRKEFKPTSDAVVFFVYVSFFPQLVAGPIINVCRSSFCKLCRSAFKLVSDICRVIFLSDLLRFLGLFRYSYWYCALIGI